MKGKYEIKVRNRRIQYQFTIERNITILKGDSATGKTTLIEMIAEYGRRGADSGITLVCKKPCVVQNGSNWQLILENTRDSIVFIDEGEEFVRSTDFAKLVKNSDNYYVIATRSGLKNLPYSVKEIYGIKNIAGNKYQGTKRLYSTFYPLYADVSGSFEVADCMVVEDSHAGYDFFSEICRENGAVCLSAGGNSNIEATVSTVQTEKVMVIADGAAFGPYIERLLDLRQLREIGIYLPESFEWLVLRSNLLNDPELTEILEHPYDFIESKENFSWEQYFTALLIEKSAGTYLAYRKSELNKNYLNAKEKSAILDVIFDMQET